MYNLPPVPLCREMAVLIPRRLRSQLAFQLQGHPAGPSLSWETVSECHGHNLLSVTCTLLSKLASKLQLCFGHSVNLSGLPVLGLSTLILPSTPCTPHTHTYSHTHSHTLTHTHTCACTHIHTHTHSYTHTHSHNSPSHTLTLPHTLTHTLSHTLTHTHASRNNSTNSFLFSLRKVQIFRVGSIFVTTNDNLSNLNIFVDMSKKKKVGLVRPK